MTISNVFGTIALALIVNTEQALYTNGFTASVLYLFGTAMLLGFIAYKFR